MTILSLKVNIHLNSSFVVLRSSFLELISDKFWSLNNISTQKLIVNYTSVTEIRNLPAAFCSMRASTMA